MNGIANTNERAAWKADTRNHRVVCVVLDKVLNASDRLGYTDPEHRANLAGVAPRLSRHFAVG